MKSKRHFIPTQGNEGGLNGVNMGWPPRQASTAVGSSRREQLLSIPGNSQGGLTRIQSRKDRLKNKYTTQVD